VPISASAIDPRIPPSRRCDGRSPPTTITGAGAVSADQVAAAAGCHPTLVRQWLDGQAAAGLVMILMGIAMMTGYLATFAFWLLEQFPVLGRIG
jgi:hypothetical protein